MLWCGIHPEGYMPEVKCSPCLPLCYYCRSLHYSLCMSLPNRFWSPFRQHNHQSQDAYELQGILTDPYFRVSLRGSWCPFQLPSPLHLSLQFHAPLVSSPLTHTPALVAVLGQLHTGDNSPRDKNKAQLLPTTTTIPRATPHSDNCPPGPLPTSKTTHQDQYLHSGELSWWEVVRIQSLVLSIHLFHFLTTPTPSCTLHSLTSWPHSSTARVSFSSACISASLCSLNINLSPITVNLPQQSVSIYCRSG